MKDFRAMPRRFWETYAVTLGFASLLAWSFAHHEGWFVIGPVVVALFGLLSSLRIAYQLGQLQVYRETLERDKERAALLQELSDKVVLIERIANGRIQGPS